MAIIGASLSLIGCGREKETESPSPPAPQSVSTGAVLVVPKTIDAAPTNAVPMTNRTTVHGGTEVPSTPLQIVATNIQGGASAALDRAQGVLDAARQRIHEEKWTEALSLLEPLSRQQLTEDQQAVLQSLRDQIQKGVRAAGASKIGEEVNRLLEGSQPPK